MSPQASLRYLVCGAGALALWVIARYTELRATLRPWRRSSTSSSPWSILTMLLPTAIDVVGASGIPAATYVQAFGVALPLFVYAFLSGGWVAKVALGMLR